MDDEPIYQILQKGTEVYCFCGTATRESELEEVFARYAANPDLSFSWLDALKLSQDLWQDSVVSALLPIANPRDS